MLEVGEGTPDARTLHCLVAAFAAECARTVRVLVHQMHLPRAKHTVPACLATKLKRKEGERARAVVRTPTHERLPMRGLGVR